MLVNHKSLSYQKSFIQVISDLLLSHIRYTKKELERELKLILVEFRKSLIDSQTKEAFEEKSKTLISKLSIIKTKLASLEEEEKKMISELRQRLTKTFENLNVKDYSNDSFLKLKNFNEYQNDIILGQYFLDKGFYQTFFMFEKENQMNIFEYNIYAEQKILLDYINEEKTKKILEWIKFYKKKISEKNNEVVIDLLSDMFYIYRNDEKNKGKESSEINVNCVNFIRKHFSGLTDSNRKDITKLIMSLIVENNNNTINTNKEENIDKKDNKENKETKEIISIDSNSCNKEIMTHIKKVVTDKYKEIFNLGNYSLFELLLTLGITTLKTASCEKNSNIVSLNKNHECPICGPNGCNLSKTENKIFNYVHNRSYLFCSITGKVTNASNPPMTNKEGKIVCKECVNANKNKENKFVDPVTKKECDVSEFKLLYLS